MGNDFGPVQCDHEDMVDMAAYDDACSRLAHQAKRAIEAEQKLAAAESRFAALEEGARELMQWGVTFDDPRVGYIEVQIDRESVAQLRALLPDGEAEKEGK